MVYNKKTFYVEYSLQFGDGISEFKGFLLAEDRVSAMQQINQFASDLEADDEFIDVVEEAKTYNWQERE